MRAKIVTFVSAAFSPPVYSPHYRTNGSPGMEAG